MRHIVNFSGGLCSFWAAKRVIEKHGTEDVTLLFADTLVEDADLYRFNEDASKHLGVPITRICEGRTPWELFRDEGMIGNARRPICSIQLKREVLDKWHQENCLELDSVIYIGMDWEEEGRMERLRNKKPNWRWEAPMQWAPLWDKCRMIEETEKLGLAVPRAYKEGFPHNNCGRRCVAAGISHWVHLYNVDRNAYLEWAREEEVTLAVFAERGIQSHTMLRDRRGGTTKNLTLRELARRIEQRDSLPRYDWGGCGCSLMFTREEEP